MLDRYSKLPAMLEEVFKEAKKHQQGAIGYGTSRSRWILDAPTGAGKTLVGWATALFHRPKRILIICSKNALYTWQKELHKWFPEIAGDNEILVLEESKIVRDIMWRQAHERGDKFIYITTFLSLLRDVEQAKQAGFDFIIIDECHKVRNRKAKTFQAVKALIRPKLRSSIGMLPGVLEMSGTLSGRGPQDLWGFLHSLVPGVFTSYWKYVYSFCEVEDGMFGKVIGDSKNSRGLAELTAPYIYRITEEEAGLDKVVRHVIPLKMSKPLQNAYNALVVDMVHVVEEAIVIAQNHLVLTTKLRRLLICPATLFPALGIGEMLPWILDKIADDETDAMRHCIIFVPFLDALDMYAEYLTANGFDKVFILKGGMHSEDMASVIQECKRTRGIMLCSTLYAQSFELETMSTAFMAGFDWDFNNMVQAEGRIRRLISKSIANAYYLKHENTVEEHVVDILNGKFNNVEAQFKNFEEFKIFVRPQYSS